MKWQRHHGIYLFLGLAVLLLLLCPKSLHVEGYNGAASPPQRTGTPGGGAGQTRAGAPPTGVVPPPTRSGTPGGGAGAPPPPTRGGPPWTRQLFGGQGRFVLKATNEFKRVCDRLRWIHARYRWLTWRIRRSQAMAVTTGFTGAMDVIDSMIKLFGEVAPYTPEELGALGQELNALRLRAETTKAELARLAALITNHGGTVPPCPEINQPIQGTAVNPQAAPPPNPGPPP